MGLELAEIFRRYGSEYCEQQTGGIRPQQFKAMQAIIRCRTEVLGGHIYQCQHCEETQYSYHSCRNRHCPKCQQEKGQEWLAAQQALLLPTPYFLLTFTLPAEIRALALGHPDLIYNLLFRASAEAAQTLAQDPRFVGGQIGMIGVLHTWGRNLSYHPHVHYLVPAGGPGADGIWRPARNDFLFPVKALSRLFRGKFRHALRKTALYEYVPAVAWRREWVVHCQPVGGGLPALKYLAPYIFRVAISNKRILNLADGQVTFRYQASESGKTTRMTLSALEFIRRFLCHVLPKGFVKIRYYGFFSAGSREKLAAIHQQLGDSATETSTDEEETISLPNHKIPLSPLRESDGPVSEDLSWGMETTMIGDALTLPGCLMGGMPLHGGGSVEFGLSGNLKMVHLQCPRSSIRSGYFVFLRLLFCFPPLSTFEKVA